VAVVVEGARDRRVGHHPRRRRDVVLIHVRDECAARLGDADVTGVLRAAVAERSRLYEAFREAQARLHKRKY